MSFAIEVPGAANPLNLTELCKALEAATSLDNIQRQAAGKQLATWETEQNYFPSLQTIFLDKSIPREIRFLAILQIKNGIDKYWRLSAKNTIHQDDKAFIRSRLFQGTIGEEDRAFALHNALATAKVLRIDYPDYWPHALPNIIEVLRQYKASDQQLLGGALMLLLRVVKELGAARLRKSQTALQAVTPELVYLLGEIYSERTALWTNWLASGQGDEAQVHLAMQNSLSAAKILRRLLLLGYENPAKDKVVVEFWSLTQNHFGQFLGYVSQDSGVPALLQDVIGKHLLQFTKLHLEMSEAHPASFPILPNSVPLVLAYWDLVAKFAEVFDKSGGLRQTAAANGSGSKSKVEGPILERLALKGLLLVKSCVAIVWKPVQTFRYTSKDFMQQKDAAVELLRSELLTDELVMQIVNVIITKLLIFRKADLESWEADPEDFEATEQYLGDAWQFSVRPCAERVFLDLLVYYKDLLTPPLLSYFHQATIADADIITKEAIYTAMGASAPNISQAFDFDTFLATTLVHDAQTTGPLAKVLRRRIAILISIWVPVKIADASRPIIFDIYRHIMNDKDENNDEVVRLTAARQLKEITEDFEFPSALFANYAPDILPQIITMLQDVVVEDTKQALFETLRMCIQRMEEHVLPFADPIMAALPSLWDAAGDAHMIKASIIAVLVAVVTSIGRESQQYQQAMLPIVDQCMRDPSNEAFLEDVVDLWRSLVLYSAPPLSPEMVSLEPLILPLLQDEPQVAEAAFEILKAYVILAPEAILSDNYRQATLQALSGPLQPSARGRGADALTSQRIFELIFLAASQLGGTSAVSIIVQELIPLGLLQTIVQRIHEDWEATQLTGPNASTKEVLDWSHKLAYFSVLGRIAVADPELLISALTSLGIGDIAQIWPWLSTQWFAALPAMADTEKQKLACLALTRLTELPQPIQDLTCASLQDYFIMWTTVIVDVHGGKPLGEDGTVWDGPPVSDEATPLENSECVLVAGDPLHTVRTYAFVNERLQSLVARAGGEAAFRDNWVINVDRDVLARFEKLSRAPES
ncbi:armadillo-type protein [Coniella lustricola]|uniref:Armadillo-type protein n=1 Tax=Coniella lustricola TaxID=2025994 RepID=A0A2T2ZVB3_9PEZI|nr:armadillo-type protein [Coniella lustricola]